MDKRSCVSQVIQALILFGMLPANWSLASGGPPMITDDPGTPGDGNWEINIAALTNHAADATIYQLPLIDANYGVGERFQLKLQAPWMLQSESNGATRSGAGNGLAGVKWRFYDAGEDRWQISTYPQIEFDIPNSNAARSGLAESGVNYLLPLEFMRIFGDNDINVEFGRWFRAERQADSWIAGVAFTHQVRKGVEFIAELHDEMLTHRSPGEAILNFGARWDFSEHYALLLAAGRDVHNSLAPANTLLTYCGLQMRY